MKLSIIIPVYEGAKTIRLLVEELINILKTYELQIVLINDGSKDNSHSECICLSEKYKELVKYICLSKNFGEHNAVMAGLNYAEGDYAVIIDDDFQNPPTEIIKLVEKAQQTKADVVYSYYKQKKHSLFRNAGSKFNDIVATILLDKPKKLYLSSFKCINRFLINEIIKYKGPFPYIDGIILKTTDKIDKVLVEHKERKDGKSGYTLRKLIHLWLNMFVNFSLVPLRISTFLGIIFSLIGLILGIGTVVEKFLKPELPLGYASMFVVLLLFSGVQLLILGLIGEYLGKLYLTGNSTPQFVVRERE